MTAEQTYDAIVIGAGQGAKPLSIVLAKAGLKTALSGAGPWSLDAWLFGRNENSLHIARFAGRSPAAIIGDSMFRNNHNDRKTL